MKGLNYNIESDENLIRFAREGNRQAFEEIYDRYFSRLELFFKRALWNDTELAKDMTQELFMKVIKNMSNFDEKKSFKTWIYSIANNMCKNAYRHNEVKEKAGHHFKQATVISMYKPENSLDKKVFKDELEKALMKLDPKKKTCFVLRFKHELSIAEIAQIEACSEGTIKSRLFYTLRELSEFLKPFNPKQKHG